MFYKIGKKQDWYWIGYGLVDGSERKELCCMMGKRGLWFRINSVIVCLFIMEQNFYENMKKNIEREIICYKKVFNFVIYVIKC